jgi:methylisocitrate lyase
MIQAGVAAIHMEDQVFEKRCGHLQGKGIISRAAMLDNIKAAVDARTDPDFVIMVRSDALASEGLDATIERGVAYRETGADMFFPEALTELAQYQKIKQAVQIPILANLTEFGKTPLFSLEELTEAEVDMALYPLSANRAMNLAALNVFKEIRLQGTQKKCIDFMQTRDELYEILHYHEFENKLKND